MAFTKIQTVSVTGSPSTVEFTAIPNTYKDLYVLTNFCNSSIGTAVARQELRMTFNNNTSGYAQNRGYIYDGVPTVAGDSSTSLGYIAPASANSSGAGANYFSPMELHIFSYASNVANKTGHARGSAVSNTSATWVVGFTHFGWANTSAISSIQFYFAVDNFVAGSTATLYGIS